MPAPGQHGSDQSCAGGLEQGVTAGTCSANMRHRARRRDHGSRRDRWLLAVGISSNQLDVVRAGATLVLGAGRAIALLLAIRLAGTTIVT
jgi:hypothetical protein